jgi:hypothetical protein
MVSWKSSAQKGSDAVWGFFCLSVLFCSLIIGTMTPHSQLRQFILTCLVDVSLTRRPLSHVSGKSVNMKIEYHSEDVSVMTGQTYQALSERLALPTYAQARHSVLLPISIGSSGLTKASFEE